MPPTQNVTLKLPADTVRRVKIVAAQHGTSISALLARTLDDIVGADAAYQTAKRRAFEWLTEGWHLGGRDHDG